MQWYPVQSIDGVNDLVDRSLQFPVVILKHSTRCGISSMVLDRLARQWDEKALPSVERGLIDVISDRPVSNHIAERFKVMHESPQALVLWNGEVIYHTSHMGINFAAIETAILPLLK